MATLATIFNRVVAAGTLEAVATRGGSDAYRLRPFANEEVHFFVKRIDNSRVVRQADPRAGGVCWRVIGTGGALAVLLIGLLLPGVYSLLAGYQIQALRLEQQRMLSERATLDLDEARLLSPVRLEELARLRKFVSPAPQRVVFLDATDPALALNTAGQGNQQ